MIIKKFYINFIKTRTTELNTLLLKRKWRKEIAVENSIKIVVNDEIKKFFSHFRFKVI